MAYTIAQLAKLETDVIKKMVIMNLLRFVQAWEVLPFENVDSLKVTATRWSVLPSVAFRRVNQGYTASEGQDEQVWEAVYGLGGDINFDRVFDKIKNTIVDPKQNEMNKKLKSLALKWNEYYINGDHATDVDGFEGLKKRIASYPSRQSVYFAGSSSAALDPTASVANGRAYFDKWEELHYVTNAGEVGAFFCNEKQKWGLGRVARYINASGGVFLDTTKDSFDRDIPTYKGNPIIDIGLKKDQSTQIITDEETAGDAGTDATSIYAVSFNTEQGIVGIQLSDPEVYDPLNGGEQESKPTKIMRIDWWNGLAGFGSHGAARGRNVEGASNWT